ncbi:MAG: hypothetical protein QOC62_1781 [Mycobacterium sp.]|jgi:hypothetical protein|nr:hypothetical protein [Mycobacterium sp.]
MSDKTPQTEASPTVDDRSMNTDGNATSKTTGKQPEREGER